MNLDLTLNRQQLAWLLDLVASAVEDDECASDDEKMFPARRAFLESLREELEGELAAP